MNRKIFIALLVGLFLAGCASNKRVSNAYKKGKNDQSIESDQVMRLKVYRAVDSAVNATIQSRLVVHDTIILPAKESINGFRDGKPDPDFVFKAEFNLKNMIGYPVLKNKFFLLSPVYKDSTQYFDQDKKVYYWEYTTKTFSVYVPIDHYNVIVQKKKNSVVIYARWFKLSENGDMVDLNSKEAGTSVLAGIHYTDPGIDIKFKPAVYEPEQSKDPVGNVKEKPKDDGKNTPSKIVVNPCPNTPNCALLRKKLNPKTCNCE